jgi:hypothetical protein
MVGTQSIVDIVSNDLDIPVADAVQAAHDIALRFYSEAGLLPFKARNYVLKGMDWVIFSNCSRSKISPLAGIDLSMCPRIPYPSAFESTVSWGTSEMRIRDVMGDAITISLMDSKTDSLSSASPTIAKGTDLACKRRRASGFSTTVVEVYDFLLKISSIACTIDRFFSKMRASNVSI